MPHETISLSDLVPGSSCIIQKVGCERAVTRRLMEMGLLPGTRVTVTRVAPLGDPIELRVRGYALSIRHAEAASVEVLETAVSVPAFASVATK
ncbi:MAG: ferrous iron transport protein A [Myxococcales bacterium]|nr:ferrous iron transport protein A [Myxococcales bacterium]